MKKFSHKNALIGLTSIFLYLSIIIVNPMIGLAIILLASLIMCYINLGSL